MIMATVVDAEQVARSRARQSALRGGDQVSTTGKTDATGAFRLRARAGTFGLTVVTPLAAGGLESRLDPVGGLVVDDATASTTPLAIGMQTGALVTGTVALLAPEIGEPHDGTTRATLTTTVPLASIPATLAVGTGAPRALATGKTVRLSLGAPRRTARSRRAASRREDTRSRSFRRRLRCERRRHDRGDRPHR